MGDLANAAAGIESDVRTLIDRMALAEARLAALEAPPPPPPPPTPDPPGWVLAWSDEFNEAFALGPDPAKWTIGENSWGGQVNASEHQAWFSRNSTVENGMLRLTAKREPTLGKQYTSGIVHTKGKAEWLPPLRVEVRARYPVGNGFWPGLWLLHDEGRRAGTFEIDILEVMGQKPDETYHTYHWYPADFDHKEIDGNWAWAVSANVDHKIVTVPPAGPRTVATGRPLICDRPMHLIADLSLGGWGGNAPDATTPLPSSLDIDWVRVYRWSA
jgi:beta-glucanase (GH16 family)